VCFGFNSKLYCIIAGMTLKDERLDTVIKRYVSEQGQGLNGEQLLIALQGFLGERLFGELLAAAKDYSTEVKPVTGRERVVEDDERTKGVNAIVGSVTRLNLHGRLNEQRIGSIKGEIVVDKNHSGGEFDHGPSREMYQDNRAFYGLYTNLVRVDRDLLNRFSYGLFSNEISGGRVMVNIAFYRTRGILLDDCRGFRNSMNYIQVEMPQGQRDRLLEELRQDPSVLETFIDTLVPGLRNDDGVTGMVLPEIKNIFVLDLDRLDRFTYVNGPYEDKGEVIYRGN